MDEKNVAFAADFGNNARVGDITFFTSFRDKKDPIAGTEVFYLFYFTAEFGLLPGNARHFNAHFGINLANQAGAINPCLVVPAGPVWGPGEGTGNLNDLRYAGRILTRRFYSQTFTGFGCIPRRGVAAVARSGRWLRSISVAAPD